METRTQLSRSKNIPSHFQQEPCQYAFGVSKTLICVRLRKDFAWGFPQFAPRKEKLYARKHGVSLAYPKWYDIGSYWMFSEWLSYIIWSTVMGYATHGIGYTWISGIFFYANGHWWRGGTLSLWFVSKQFHYLILLGGILDPSPENFPWYRYQ